MKEASTIDKVRLYGFEPFAQMQDIPAEMAATEVEDAEISATDAYANFVNLRAKPVADGDCCDDGFGAEPGAELVLDIEQQNREAANHRQPVPHRHPAHNTHPSHPSHPGHDRHPSHPGHDRHPGHHDSNRHNFNPHSGSAPRFAPPTFVPQASPGLRAVDPAAIASCLYSFTYLWLSNRHQFWFFPTFVGRRSVAGYRWIRNSWVYMGFDLRMIDSFFCNRR